MRRARGNVWVSAVLLLVIAVWLARQWPDRSLWYDETVNAYFAERSWSDIWEWCAQIDNQLPLDFVLRNVWGSAVGTSEFALRAFSFSCALLSVAGMIALGRGLGGTSLAGWLTGLVFALSQGFLYAVYEIRPYALALALFAWASVVFWWLWNRYVVTSRPFDRRYWQWLMVYVLLALALLYTHYTAFMALAAHAAYAGWHWVVHPSVRRRSIILVHAAFGLTAGYLPWLIALAGRDIRAGTAYAGGISPREALQTYTEFFVFGQRIAAPDTPPYALAIIGVIGLALAILIVGRKVVPRSGVVFALVVSVIPLAGLLVMVYAVQAKLSGRHGWPVWIGISLMIGLGLATLQHVQRLHSIRGPIWIAVLVIIWLPAQAELQPYYNSYLREAIAYINDHAEPNDVLVLHDGTLFTAAGYYDAALPWSGIPPDELTDVEHTLFLETALTALDTLITSHDARRIWVLSWQGHIMDPQNLTFGLLDALGNRQPLEGTFGFGDVTVALYEMQQSPQMMRSRIRALNTLIETPGGGPVLLGGYVLNDRPEPVGGTVHIHTWWQRGSVVMPDMRVSVRLYDSAGAFYSQHDQPPVAPPLGQELWLPDTPILGQFTLQVPMDMPPGTAEVRLIIYHMQGAFEPITVLIDTVEIAD